MPCVNESAAILIPAQGEVIVVSGQASYDYCQVQNALPNSRIMIHQPWGGAEGTAADIDIQAKEILRLKEMLNGILAAHSGQSLKKIYKDTERDFFMSAAEAVDYHLVDKVVAPRERTGK